MNAAFQPPEGTSADQTTIDQLLAAMAQAGIMYDDHAPVIGDGKLHRFHVEGDAPGDRNGWYCFHDDATPAGNFGCMKRYGQDIKLPFSAKRAKPLTPQQKTALATNMAAQKAKREAEDKAKHTKAAEQAKAIWGKATPVGEESHPYLLKKGIQAHGTRTGSFFVRQLQADGSWANVLVSNNALLIPRRSQQREIVSLQAIFPSADNVLGRDRTYLANGEAQGTYDTIGQPQRHEGRPVFLLCEGFATGAALHESTGHCAVVAFDAGNLIHVAKRIAMAQKEAILVICADHDQWTTQPVENPGLYHARLAAKAVGGRVMWPDFPANTGTPDPETGKLKGPTDFDDLRRLQGDEAVREVLEACLNAPQGPDNGPQGPTPGAAAEMATAWQDEPPMVERVDPRVRRRQQKEENGWLQEESAPGEMVPTHMTVEEMCASLVYISTGQQVAYLGQHRILFHSINELIGHTLSATSLPSEKAKKPIPNARLWQESPHRKSVTTLTFAPGQGIICTDPHRARAVNTWRPIERWPPQTDITLFLDHLAYLFPDEEEREAFLDWLAHLEQKPGELPHYGWLHIAKHTGCGRNWLASVLARLWCGYVAPNVDLPGLLTSSFNGKLAGKLLAMVDEIQEGGHDNSYRYANQLKSIVNAEQRHINPKYGSEYCEFNACRWLVFSNHANSLPIDATDRRWRVVMLSAPPREAGMYAELYAAMKDPEFINAVGVYLAERDIAAFNPGERPPNSLAKQTVVKAAKSLMQQRADEIMASWPCELITNEDVALIFTEDQEKRLTSGMRRAMEDAGAESLDDPKRVIRGEAPKRIWLLRRPDYWRRQSSSQLPQDEYAKARRREERYPSSPSQVLAAAAEQQSIAR